MKSKKAEKRKKEKSDDDDDDDFDKECDRALEEARRKAVAASLSELSSLYFLHIYSSFYCLFCCISVN